MKPLCSFRGFVSLVLVLVSVFAHASPEGRWRTIDDSTGETKSIVEIYGAADGTLEGRVLEVLRSDQGPHPICKECPADRKDQPIEGMVIIWGMKAKGDQWGGGHILDPKNGKTYKCKLSLSKDDRLEVRGFIGVPVLGRTQIWTRELSNEE